MAAVNQDISKKFKKASRNQRNENNGANIEVREDEEQFTKSQEIIDLLVAAGYFRARIKGLSPFDKVVGGMVWCIESLNADVDVDLLFQENSTIGQKISLTEKIVVVLPKIKCPYTIEPHQIQGLDFIHIFPVIQWLVKASMEAREEKSSFVRLYAINQFNKAFMITEKTEEKLSQTLENLKIVNEVYRPQRYYKRKNAPPPDILSRVQITLLEYGYRGSTIKSTADDSRDDEKKEARASIEEEQNKLDQLSLNLTAAKEEVFQEIFTEEDKKRLKNHYEILQSELKDGGIQSKNNQKQLLLEEQTRLLETNIVKLKHRKHKVEEEILKQKDILRETKLARAEAESSFKEFEEEKRMNPSEVKEIEELVILKDKLKSEETQFKESCKQELVRLQKEIEEFKQIKTPTEPNPQLKKEIENVSEKIKLLRLSLAKKNQIVLKLQMQLDDVPNRAEMTQYQKRFLELYNQVAAKHKETKQYYSLYNTLEDKRMYLKKELSLLNSISENYPEAMMSASAREEFMGQLQRIVEGVQQNRLKIEFQISEVKRRRERLNSTLHDLLELQRSYAATLKQLSLECSTYEALLASKR
ncbi:coiled-coil domain-containing protein 93 isoform X1 [Rhynchophorus ferrugineus]|uniref:coiled-coil domain-containing protein 93 isoform X1 n=1 Tax=Rhynchophorus ferrugineus TaxID=354439 RepID=UPI003FCC5EF0